MVLEEALPFNMSLYVQLLNTEPYTTTLQMHCLYNVPYLTPVGTQYNKITNVSTYHDSVEAMGVIFQGWKIFRSLFSGLVIYGQLCFMPHFDRIWVSRILVSGLGNLELGISGLVKFSTNTHEPNKKPKIIF